MGYLMQQNIACSWTNGRAHNQDNQDKFSIFIHAKSSEWWNQQSTFISKPVWRHADIERQREKYRAKEGVGGICLITRWEPFDKMWNSANHNYTYLFYDLISCWENFKV